MKKVLSLILLFIIVFCAKSQAEELPVKLPNIFIYSLPDDEENIPSEAEIQENEYINNNAGNESFDEVNLYDDKNEEKLNASILKGYAEYMEGQDIIYLLNDKDKFALDLKKPQRITDYASGKLMNKIISNDSTYSKFDKEEHFVADKNVNTDVKFGNFSLGTSYGQEVDNISMLENSTSMFSKYQRNKFSLSSKFEKTLNTTIGTYSDSFSFAPEYRFNDFVAIKEVLSSNISKNRKSGELIFSLSPMGFSNGDRLRLEIGAKHTVNQDNSLYGTQLNFSTKFKL